MEIGLVVCQFQRHVRYVQLHTILYEPMLSVSVLAVWTYHYSQDAHTAISPQRPFGSTRTVHKGDCQCTSVSDPVLWPIYSQSKTSGRHWQTNDDIKFTPDTDTSFPVGAWSNNSIACPVVAYWTVPVCAHVPSTTGGYVFTGVYCWVPQSLVSGPLRRGGGPPQIRITIGICPPPTGQGLPWTGKWVLLRRGR